MFKQFFEATWRALIVCLFHFSFYWKSNRYLICWKSICSVSFHNARSIEMPDCIHTPMMNSYSQFNLNTQFAYVHHTFMRESEIAIKMWRIINFNRFKHRRSFKRQIIIEWYYTYQLHLLITNEDFMFVQIARESNWDVIVCVWAM